MYYKTLSDKHFHKDSKKEAEKLYKTHLMMLEKRRVKSLRKKRRRAEFCLIFRLYIENLLGNRNEMETVRKELRKQRRKKKLNSL